MSTDNPQTEITKRTGGAKGAYYEGLLATSLDRPDGKTFAIFAADISMLSAIWGQVSTTPLNEDLVQRVAIFSRSAVSESKRSF